MAPPLTQQEKAQLVEATSVTVQGILASAAPAGPLSLPILPFIPPVIGLLQLIGRARFPQLDPSALLGTIKDAITLRERGLEPVIGTDPFTGNVSLSTQDQSSFLSQLQLEAAIRNQEIPSSDSLSLLRTELNEALALTAESRGFFPSVASVEDLRGGVFRPTADAPLQFIQTGAA